MPPVSGSTRFSYPAAARGKHWRAYASLVRSEPCSEHWARPEWRVEAERWIRSTLDGLGVSVTGAMEQQRLRPWSTQLTVATDVGRVWFKENCPGQWFEAGLLAALAELVPDAVVAPLAVEPERGWFLTPDHGATLADRLEDVDLWARLAADWADVQRRLLPHGDSLTATGMTTVDPAAVASYVEARVAANAGLPPADTAHLPADDAARLRAALPEIARWGRELADGPLPVTLDHNDLHANNVFVPQPGEAHLRIFDFADAVVGHPFGSLLVPMNVLSGALEAAPDDPRLRRVVDAYLEPWTELADATTLRRLVPPALRLARLNRHESWRRVLDTVSADERAEYGHLQPFWLSKVLDPLAVSVSGGTGGARRGR